jgi:hypothetical protein
MRMAPNRPEAVRVAPAPQPPEPLVLAGPLAQVCAPSMAAEMRLSVETSPDPPPLHQATTPLLI